MGAEGKCKREVRRHQWPKISIPCGEIRCHPKLIHIADFFNIILGLFLKYGSFLGWIPVIYYYNRNQQILHAPSFADLQPSKLLNELEVFVEIQEGINADFKAIGETLTNPVAKLEEALKPTEAPAHELDGQTKFFKHHSHKEKKEEQESVVPAVKMSLGLKPFVAPKPVFEDTPAVKEPEETTVDASPMDKNSDWADNIEPTKKTGRSSKRRNQN